MSMSLEESAAARERADFQLRGSNPSTRRSAARILVNAARIRGEEPEQWVLDVAEGRLPA
ncbi:hypothetical protein HUN08_17295 [Gordonia sp. X0973]|uniref:hypothetical protein n=1 Tax=Gordonia sp. X0973 TaxID=2742602 RepID=UPI000F5250B9|nr:hypothetical protein [Gordonia sp. X0973]QKT08761.1 hypothetical protein HUN08_17295 [Gordonia sp. X0973]